MQKCLVIFALLLIASLSAQAPSRMSDKITENSCRFTFDDDPIPNCLVVINKQTYIAAPYRSRLDFHKDSLSPIAARYGLAVVLGGRSFMYFMYVDRSGRVLINNVVEFDNGPSDFHYGVVRVRVGGKYNYANPSGALLFSSGFDWSGPFSRGHAYGCVGCRMICRYPPANWGECEDIDISWVGDTWFRLTPRGGETKLMESSLYPWMRDPGVAGIPTFHR